MTKFKFLKIVVFLLFITNSFAQEDSKLVALSKQIIEAKTNEDLYLPFEELKGLYFNENKYTEFIDFLKSLVQKKKTTEPFINYYVALTRYNQLRYLEEKQLWDEYFSLGNTYRDELTQGAQKAIDITTQKDGLNIYAGLLLWQFHKDQQDVFAENSLSDLVNSVLEYAKSASDTKPIKEVADKLLFYGEKGKSKELYKIYANKIITSNIKDDALLNIASGFYKEGNLELSQTLYDVYIGRITKSAPKEKLIPNLVEIANLFAYSATGGSALGGKDEGLNDMLYAEKVFERIEELGGKAVFNQDLMYLRAFNLEKAKEYQKAKDAYNDLVLTFPETIHADEAVFKTGIIYTYILRDISTGRNYFEKLAKKENLSPQVISSLYQLGLLSQWQDDNVLAKGYYNSLIEKVKFDFTETVALAKERLREIEEGQPLEYNLKTFLDISLKEEYRMFDMTKLDLKSHPYKTKKQEVVNISSTANIPQSGCMQVQLQYLWSGDLGNKKPSPEQPIFDTTYLDSGTKVINSAVVSPTGIIDRSFDLVDVY